MNELKVFNYQDNEVRTVEVDGEPWFVLKDVCNVLGLGSAHKVADRLDEDERTQIPLTDSMGREQQTTIVSESGLYNVILRSDKPEAKPFRKWVTGEVLPAIRKTGGYRQKALSPVEMFAMQAQINLDQERRLKAVEQKQAVLDGVMDVMAAPLLAEDGWQEKAQKAINSAVERFQTNHQTFRAELYEDVEAGLGLGQGADLGLLACEAVVEAEEVLLLLVLFCGLLVLLLLCLLRRLLLL